MRIAMLGQKHIPSGEGGIEVVVEELATRMAALGHSLTCLDRRGHHIAGKHYDSDKTGKYRGVFIKDVPTINRRGLAAVSSSISAAFIAAVGPYDIVHFHAEGPALMCFIPKIFGKKVVVTIHGLDWKRAKWGRLSREYIKLGEWAAAKFSDGIIVLNRDTKLYFERRYNRDTVYIPNGVSLPSLRAPDIIKEKWGLDKEGYILFLGRLVPEKGIHLLIRAFMDTDTKKKLVIAGAGSDTRQYVKKLRDMADERVIFTGFVQGEELFELYTNAYIYCLPSELEGMPMSLLEAMSYGNCCLVSDIPECLDVVEDKGISFRNKDVEDLKLKLCELIRDRDRVHRLKDASSSFICEKYKWDEVVRSTLELYKRAESGEKESNDR